MSTDIEDLAESSTNLGVVTTTDGLENLIVQLEVQFTSLKEE